jgi:hypothetical protein
MATTRKRARTEEGQFKADDPSTPHLNEAWITTDGLAEFIGFNGDKSKLDKAIKLSASAAEAFLGKPVPAQMSHNLAQGLKLLATKLLLTDKLSDSPTEQEIPLVVRYYFRLAADAGR